ncbi:MAG: 50S ribosomal protein L15e [archaeon]
MGAYKYIRKAWQKPNRKAQRERYIQWRSEERFMRLERPTRIDRARSLGYKAKGGFVVIRARIGAGGRKRPKIKAGRKPSNTGQFFTTGRSLQAIVETRVARRHPNMEVLNSYWVGADGKHKWYEVILVDPCHPQIEADTDINWICGQRGRAYRGLTSAGKKGRGLRRKGKGSEHTRKTKK